MKEKTHLDIFSERVEVEISDLIHEMFKLELSTLEKITKFTESIGNKLIKLYDEKFPKKCNCCGKIYESRNEYLKATFPIKKKSAVRSKENVLEFRNCVCGSTLAILLSDRRECNDFGKARRSLFNICVEKFKKISKKDENEIKEIVRQIFRHIIKKTQVLESLEDYEFTDLVS